MSDFKTFNQRQAEHHRAALKEAEARRAEVDERFLQDPQPRFVHEIENVEDWSQGGKRPKSTHGHKEVRVKK